MMQLEAQELFDLVNMLRETERCLTSLGAGDCDEQLKKSRSSLKSFHTTAAMLGLEGLEKAGIEFEKFLTGQVSPENMDAIAALGFAISLTISRMEDLARGSAGINETDLSEILELLRPQAPSASANNGDESPFDAMLEISPNPNGTDAEPAGENSSDSCFGKLNELITRYGGKLSVNHNGDAENTFTLTFTGSITSLKQIDQLFFAGDSLISGFNSPSEENAVENLLAKGKAFIDAFSKGDLAGAQRILLTLAEHCNSDLYKQVGTLARGLHDSIRAFANSLDPSLDEMVKEKIPDSGNRLEHMLQMTEKAATTTLDHVDNMNERLSGEMEQISALRGIITGLKAIGDSAGKKLEQSAQILDGLETTIGLNRSDLDTILTAQDYQDLTGQIILKIITLLKDIEAKLVGLIRTFGVKSDTGKQKEGPELYGPAHAAVENAVHSQDEVNSLLAEFGF